MICKVPGCDKDVRDWKDSQHCSAEHQFIDNHRYIGETLAEYTKRRAYWLKYRKHMR